MTDLYRRLLKELTERFGGAVDDANADAIAYAAAELYHRDFEPRLWQEKSAHDMLDLFGVPRGSGLAEYSLSDRLVLFQRRSSQAHYVTRAHEVLTALGVPRTDEKGVDQTLKWRLDRILESVNGEQAVAGKAGNNSGGNDGSEDKAAVEPAGVTDNPPGETTDASQIGAKADKEKEEEKEKDAERAGAEAVTAEGTADGTADGKVPTGEVPSGEDVPPVTVLELPDEPQAGNGKEDTSEGVIVQETTPEVPPPSAVAPAENGLTEPAGEAAKSPTESLAEAEAEAPEPVDVDTEGETDAKTEAETKKEPEESEDSKDSTEPDSAVPGEPEKNGAPVSEPVVAKTGSANGPDLEPSPAQLADAVRALEQAAEVEAQLATAPESPGGLNLVTLTETLAGIQGEIAALRDLVEAFEIGMRRQLDQLESRLTEGNQQASLAPAPSEPAPLLPRPTDPTHEMPPVLVDESAAEGAVGDEGEAGAGRPKGRRVLLLVLLVLLGVLIAGAIAVGVALGWDSIRNEAGLLLPYELAAP